MLPIFRIHERAILLLPNKREIEKHGEFIVREHHSALPFLRDFGHLIKSLKFYEKRYSKEHAIQIYKYIEKYCSNTLAEINLITAGSHLTTHTKITFPSVIKLDVSHMEYINHMEIDRIYPALEDLTIGTLNEISQSIGKFLPSLARLHVVEYLDFENDIGIRELLRCNPQLRALKLSRVPSLDLLKFISETSMNLECLSISYKQNEIQSATGDAVHFTTVKNFTIEVDERNGEIHVTPITFEQLTFLEISSHSFDMPVNLLKENAGLKSLSLPKGNEECTRRTLNEAGPFQSLEELKIQWFNYNDTSIVMHAMERFETLKRIILIVYELEGDALNLNAIRANFQGEWRVTDYQFVKTHSIFDVYYVTIGRE